MAINLSTLVNQTNPLQLAKAWVNFNGTTATPSTIRSSYNVSSITKNNTGDYTVNFATPMADANYSASGCTDGLDGNSVVLRTYDSGTGRSTTSIRIQTFGVTFSNSDSAIVQLHVFGN